MPNLNRVTLMGHLAGDPELKKPKDKSLCTFTLAVNGSGRDDADFIPCEVWGGWAENLAKSAKKGALVLIEGNLTQDRWTDRESGENRSRLKVVAQRSFHLESGGAREPGQEG